MDYRIALINPRDIARDKNKNYGKNASPFQNLGLAYLTSFLREKGHSVELIDAMFSKKDNNDVLEDIKAMEPDFVGMTATHQNIDGALRLFHKIKEYDNKIFTCLGGHHCTHDFNKIFSKTNDVDCIVRGEGEVTLFELVEFLRVGGILTEETDIPGIVFKREGNLVKNDPLPYIDNLDKLPFPARDPLKKADEISNISIMSSRGCQRRCNFCESAVFYRLTSSSPWRARSPENLVDEIEILVDRYDVNNIFFGDDNFIGPPEKGIPRATEIANLILDRGIDLRLQASFRADSYIEDKRELKPLIKAGLQFVCLGIESGCKSQLARYNKGITVKKNREIMEWLEKSSIDLSPGFIMFDPYVTFFELKQNARFLESFNYMCVYNEAPTFASKLIIYPGLKNTPLVKQLEKDGLLYRNEGLYNYFFKHDGVGRLFNGLQALTQSFLEPSYHPKVIFDFQSLKKRFLFSDGVHDLPLFEKCKLRGEKLIGSINEYNYNYFVKYCDLAEEGWDEDIFQNLLEDHKDKILRLKSDLKDTYDNLLKHHKGQ